MKPLFLSTVNRRQKVDQHPGAKRKCAHDHFVALQIEWEAAFILHSADLLKRPRVIWGCAFFFLYSANDYKMTELGEACPAVS